MDSRLAELRQAKAQGAHLRVIGLAREILADPEGVTDREAIEAARAATTAAMATRQPHLAVQMAGYERRWADGTGDAELVAIAAYHQGTVWLHMGDNHMATEHLEEFQAAGDLPGLARFQGAAWFNLGIARMGYRDYPGAVKAFTAARGLFENAGNLRGQAQCWLEAAWAELMAGRPEQAGHYIDEAVPILGELDDPQLQAVYLCHKALYHRRVGDVNTAMALCHEVLTPGRAGVDAHQAAEAAWIAGECALQLGLLDEAGNMADVAVARALDAVWPALMTQASDLRRRVREARDNTA